ncbi:MAG: hypothetical protein MJ209_05620 [archaeon]|nr:hypothetical protein [archaeon]
MNDERLFEMRLPNGVGEQMLAHCYEKFDVKLEQGEYGPKLLGTREELEKAQKFLYDAIEKRLKELEE